MRIYSHRPFFALFGLLASQLLVAQEPSLIGKDTTTPRLSEKTLARLDNKVVSLSDDLEKNEARYLSKFAAREHRLKKQLYKLDSVAARRLFTGVEDRYAAFQIPLHAVGSAAGPEQYIPYLDSINGVLSYLNKNPQLLSSGVQIQDKLKDVGALRERLQQAGALNDFLQQRQTQIAEVMHNYTKMPQGLSNAVAGFNKDVYYYGAQVREYKQILKDPSRAEQKALEVLNKLPAFTTFMQKNSMLSQLFGSSASASSPEAIAGLQTRDQVQKVIGDRLGQAGIQGQAVMQDNLQAAQSQLSQLKDKLSQNGAIGGGADIPNFKPNTQKTKTFLQRIDYGVSFQTVTSNNYYPSVTAISLDLGYKLSDKSLIGFGPSYLLGLGNDPGHMAFSLRGYGARSYFDHEVIKGFYATGAAEFNWWGANGKSTGSADHTLQPAALAGISKKIKAGKRGQGSAQLLYNVLWQQQTPAAKMLEFRVGYSLK